jgi:uncharacterized membrane protein YjfL (UPF0719 family)
MNKTQKVILSLVILSVMLVPVMALAAFTVPAEPTTTSASFKDIIDKVGTIVSYAFMALTVLLFVYAGVKFLLAGGAPEKVAEARTAAIWGVVGVIVIVLAYSIISVVQTLIS